MFDLEHQKEYQLQFGKRVTQISPFALRWMEIHTRELARKHKRKIRIMEFGSGVSTVWMGQKWPEYEICSVEGNREWYKQVKEWLEEKGVKNVNLKFVEQEANFRLKVVEVNPDYVYPFGGDWDLIINDGGIRETIGDETMLRADKLLRIGGIYLRHDYEKAITGQWIQTGHKELGYDGFCAWNDGYELITITGNGVWGYLCELGGIWRKD